MIWHHKTTDMIICISRSTILFLSKKGRCPLFRIFSSSESSPKLKKNLLSNNAFLHLSPFHTHCQTAILIPKMAQESSRTAYRNKPNQVLRKLFSESCSESTLLTIFTGHWKCSWREKWIQTLHGNIIHCSDV